MVRRVGLVLLLLAPGVAAADAIRSCPPGEHVVRNPTRPGARHHGGSHCVRDDAPPEPPPPPSVPIDPDLFDDLEPSGPVEAPPSVPVAPTTAAEPAPLPAVEAPSDPTRAAALAEAAEVAGGTPFVPSTVASSAPAPEPPTDPGGCGCAAGSTSPPSGLAGLALALAVARRVGRRR